MYGFFFSSPQFCLSYSKDCAGAKAGTAYADCAAQVSAMEAGKQGDTSGDTFQCRAYHLGKDRRLVSFDVNYLYDVRFCDTIYSII